MKVLYTKQVIAKTLKNDKNNILYACFEYINEIYEKKLSY